jgi:Acetyltransferase (GNAT) family
MIGKGPADLERTMTERWSIRDGLHRLVIGALAVDQTHRRAGVGTALMEAAEDRGRSLGAEVALTDTNIRSYMSLPFYEDRMGYDRRAAILRKVLLRQPVRLRNASLRRRRRVRIASQLVTVRPGRALPERRVAGRTGGCRRSPSIRPACRRRCAACRCR